MLYSDFLSFRLQNLEGPVYQIGSPKHHFSEIVKNLDTIKNLTGPVYACDHVNAFSDIIKQTQKVSKELNKSACLQRLGCNYKQLLNLLLNLLNLDSNCKLFTVYVEGINHCLLIAVGKACGSCLRCGAQKWIPRHHSKC